MNNVKNSRILEEREKEFSKWLIVVNRNWVALGEKHGENYRCILPKSYVNNLAITKGQSIDLIRQYRHALKPITFELPQGLMGLNKSSEETALIELREEIGLGFPSVVFLGVVNTSLTHLGNP